MNFCYINSDMFLFTWNHWDTQRGEGDCWAAVPPPLKERELKNRDFVDTMISKVLHDLRFSPNQSVQSAYDWYIRY